MRWDDERYVRLYCPRNDGDWDMWPWQSRALFPLMLRRSDRAGLLKVGRHDVRALAHMVGLPVEVAEVGIAGLLDDGCVTRIDRDGTIFYFVRNYLQAQEAAQTNRVRVSEHRARAADLAAAGEVINVSDTNRYTAKQIVTECNGQKQPVTPSRAEPCRTEEKPPASRVARSGGAGGEQLPLGADTHAGAGRDDVADTARTTDHAPATSTAAPARTTRPAPARPTPPLPFRAARAAELVAEEAGTAFVLPEAPLAPGHSIAIEKHVRSYQDPDDWRALGAHLAAQTWRQAPAGPSLLASAKLPELIEAARQWDQAGRPPLDGKPQSRPQRATTSPASTPWKPPVNTGEKPAYMRTADGGAK